MLLSEDITGSEPAEKQIPQEEAAPPSDIDVSGEEKSVEEIIKASEGEVEEKKDVEKEEKKEAEPKEEKKEHEPPPEHPRYKKIYGKMKHAERQVEELKSKVKELESKVQGVADERTKEQQQKADAEVDKLWEDWSEAISEMDGKKAANIHRKIMEIESKKAAPVPQKEPKAVTDEEIEKRIEKKEAERAVDDFKKRNPWFEKDKPMRKYAIGVEEDLIEEGFEGTTAERLAEVEARVKKRFGTKKSLGLPSVASAGSTKRTTSDNVIELSDEEKKVAYGVYPGIPRKEAEAEYIKDLKKYGRSK